MNRHHIYLFLMTLLVGVTACQAGDVSGLDKVEGSYEYTFPNRLMDGTQYTSKNQLLIMRDSQNTAYFNTHLDWANGHSCDLAGIADIKSQSTLVYRVSSIMNKTCRFEINIQSNKIVFGDKDGACRLISCGARGMLDEVEFELKSRKQIKPAVIKKSREYIRALEEYNSSAKAKTP